MNCIICHRPMVASGTTSMNSFMSPSTVSTTSFLTCNPETPTTDHGFSVFLENNQISIFTIGLDNWFISCSNKGWYIQIYKDDSEPTIPKKSFASPPNVLSPEEAHQLLLKYIKLKAFS